MQLYILILVKAELNPKAATLDLYAYLVPFLVLNNITKCKKSQSNRFLTTPTYIHSDGIADTWADWAMISNRPGNNKKIEAAHHICNGIKFSFPRFIWFCWAAIFFYFHQVLSLVWWLETLDTSGYVWALEKVAYELISPTYMFKGFSSALSDSSCCRPSITTKTSFSKLQHRLDLTTENYWTLLKVIIHWVEVACLNLNTALKGHSGWAGLRRGVYYNP